MPSGLKVCMLPCSQPSPLRVWRSQSVTTLSAVAQLDVVLDYLPYCSSFSAGPVSAPLCPGLSIGPSRGVRPALISKQQPADCLHAELVIGQVESLGRWTLHRAGPCLHCRWGTLKGGEKLPVPSPAQRRSRAPGRGAGALGGPEVGSMCSFTGLQTDLPLCCPGKRDRCSS